jgi:hypothetical protein
MILEYFQGKQKHSLSRTFPQNSASGEVLST